MRRKSTLHHSKPPHQYGLPKTHKAGAPLRPIISCRNSSASELVKFLLPIVQTLEEKTITKVKNSQHFVEILRSVNIEPIERLVRFDVESLNTNVSLDEALTT